MASPADAVLAVRQFSGVNVALDPAFLTPDVLQASDNFVPDPAYRLVKRAGTGLFLQHTGSAGGIDALLRTYDATTRYLYAAALSVSGGNDRLVLSTNDGAFADVVTFGSAAQRYGMAVLGGFLYVGNGVDAIERTLLGSLTATALTALAVTSTTGSSAVLVADTNSTLPTGTYTYAWAIYDKVLKQWISRSAFQTVKVTAAAGSGQDISFQTPSVALAANQLYHLFVTLPDAPGETAHDQTPDGMPANPAAGDTFVLRTVVSTGTNVPLSNVTRKGRYFVPHRGRIWFAGDQTVGNRNRLFATSIIVPGLEQAIYDQGDFFPADANERIGLDDGDEITGLAVATLTSSQRSPSAPLAIFKTTQTWFWLGDILDDPSAELVLISNRVGAIAQATIVPTPVGLISCGLDSVYLVVPNFQEPLDIGQAIAPVIKGIPPSRRAFACARYEHGFYKLCLTPSGRAQNVQEWWLDLRRGLGNPPSWWGPHTVPARTAFTVGLRDPTVLDQSFAALVAAGGNTDVVVLEQASATDRVPGGGAATIVSRLRGAALTGDQPFQRKIGQRARVMARTDMQTSVAISLSADEGIASVGTAIVPQGTSTWIWNSATWNVSTWVLPTFVEATVIFEPRPVGEALTLELTHAEPTHLELRELELRYLPVVRPVQ